MKIILSRVRCGAKQWRKAKRVYFFLICLARLKIVNFANKPCNEKGVKLDIFFKREL